MSSDAENQIPRILIVDDEPTILKFMNVSLQQNGYITRTAQSGLKALEMAAEEKPDLVVLDVGLPDISGMLVCKNLKEMLGGFTPVLLVTVLGEVQNKVDGMNHGADDFLTKPFSPDELITRVHSLLRIKKQYDVMRNDSMRDSLTKIYNRRYFHDRMSEECDRVDRYGGVLSALMIDVDHFKRVNDTFGHPAGDDLLVQFVSRIQRLIRKTDIFARYGGEEFVALLPNTSSEHARSIAETIRLSVARKKFLCGNELIHVTCSIGVCSFPNHGINTTDHLIQCLDKSLYKAKNAGRNKIHMFQPASRSNPLPKINISNT